mgnify:CR=1 FL=1
MFDVGFSELVLLFVIGLLVLGPQRLPKVAAEIGKWVGRARRTATQLRRQLEREIELSDLQQQPIKPQPPPAAETTAPADAAVAESVAPHADAVVEAPPAATPEPEPSAADVQQSPPQQADKPPHV